MHQHNNALLAAAAAAAAAASGIPKPTPLSPFHHQHHQHHMPSPLIHLNNSPIKPLSVPEIITPIKESLSSKSSLLNSAELDYLHNSISKNKLGRSYNPGRPLAMADRARILELYEKGHKISHIARIIGVTHSCVSKIMTRYRRTGSMHPRSAQQSKKHSLASSSVSVASSSFSSGQSSASLSPSHLSNMSLNSYDSSSDSSSSSLSSSSSNSLSTPTGLLPRSDGELQISPSLFFPKSVPLALLQKC
uniref:Paired domain-containing protein n=1 Tax=Panagrolaimus sp. PS1159 TaxID=55785 RepID=A0AC35GCR9_9BILA